MHRFEFADEVRQTLARERFGHPDPRVQRRMEILWLKLTSEFPKDLNQPLGIEHGGRFRERSQ